MLIEYQNLFKKKIDSYSLNNIDKALVETKDGMETTVSRIVIKLKTGELIPIVSYYDSYSGKQLMAKYVNQFIKQ